jgi:hypothetical protein
MSSRAQSAARPTIEKVAAARHWIDQGTTVPRNPSSKGNMSSLRLKSAAAPNPPCHNHTIPPKQSAAQGGTF